jgi:hypothetical protein
MSATRLALDPRCGSGRLPRPGGARGPGVAETTGLGMTSRRHGGIGAAVPPPARRHQCAVGLPHRHADVHSGYRHPGRMWSAVGGPGRAGPCWARRAGKGGRAARAPGWARACGRDRTETGGARPRRPARGPDGSAGRAFVSRRDCGPLPARDSGAAENAGVAERAAVAKAAGPPRRFNFFRSGDTRGYGSDSPRRGRPAPGWSLWRYSKRRQTCQCRCDGGTRRGLLRTILCPADRKKLHQPINKEDRKNEVANGKHCVMMGRRSNPSVTQPGFQTAGWNALCYDGAEIQPLRYTAGFPDCRMNERHSIV